MSESAIEKEMSSARPVGQRGFDRVGGAACGLGDDVDRIEGERAALDDELPDDVARDRVAEFVGHGQRIRCGRQDDLVAVALVRVIPSAVRLHGHAAPRRRAPRRGQRGDDRTGVVELVDHDVGRARLIVDRVAVDLFVEDHDGVVSQRQGAVTRLGRAEDGRHAGVAHACGYCGGDDVAVAGADGADLVGPVARRRPGGVDRRLAVGQQRGAGPREDREPVGGADAAVLGADRHAHQVAVDVV